MRPIVSILLTLISFNTFAQSTKSFTQFIPKGFVLEDTITGELNKDGQEDVVLITRATNPMRIIQDENRGKFDRNRRGIVILFKKGSQYNKVLQNDTCFASAFEDGGVYFAPELSLEIKKGNLYIDYNHGRYGFWNYTFRYQNNDFALIGYDQSDHFGPVVNKSTSINFLTKTKIVKVNTNENADGGDEVFKTTSTKINIGKLIRLSAIKDFEDLAMHQY